MYVDGERLEGEMLDRDEARRIYEGIVRKQRDPALLEYVGRMRFVRVSTRFRRTGRSVSSWSTLKCSRWTRGLCATCIPWTRRGSQRTNRGRQRPRRDQLAGGDQVDLFSEPRCRSGPAWGLPCCGRL